MMWPHTSNVATQMSPLPKSANPGAATIARYRFLVRPASDVNCEANDFFLRILKLKITNCQSMDRT